MEDKLFTTQRREGILRLLEAQGSVSVAQLAERFQVSGTTIRLDLTALENAGSISRTHGGAVLRLPTLRESLIRERKNQEEKDRIAQRAVAFLEEQDTILIDTGTTMLAFAKALVVSSLEHLTVYSNDLDILRVLEEKEDFELYLLGGRVRNGFHYSYGTQAIAELARCHFQKLFLATSAISMEDGLTTANADLAAMKSAMVASAQEVFLLTDSTKARQVAFRQFAELSQVDTIITDKSLDSQTAAALGETVGRLILV